jgi:FixJ family two-component response regulator
MVWKVSVLTATVVFSYFQCIWNPLISGFEVNILASTTTIVVVDDDPSVRNSLSLLLKSAGYSVNTFSSARQLLEFLNDFQAPSCLLVDLKMPEIDGIGLVKELSSRDHTIPIVFMTGIEIRHPDVQGKHTGTIKVLTKPFDDIDLLNAIKAVL